MGLAESARAFKAEITKNVSHRPIRAWRVWRLTLEDRRPLLLSWVIRYEWRGPVVRSGEPVWNAHDRRASSPPDPRYGFYAVKRRWQLYSYAFAPVLGQVDLLGRVIEHEKGYRAQYARVEALELATLTPTLYSDQFGPLRRGWMRYNTSNLPTDGGAHEVTREIADQLADRYRCQVEYRGEMF